MICGKCGTTCPDWASVCSGCTRDLSILRAGMDVPDAMVFWFFMILAIIGGIFL